MRTTTWRRLRWLPITLQQALVPILGAAALVALSASRAQGQQDQPAFHGGHSHSGNHPTLHVNPRWKECSFQLDASLTQAAWRQFAGEAGMVTYFRPLVGAEPMGAGNFEFSILQWKTGIDAGDAAWNDTFVHPDSAHWLFEGSGLAFPGLTARAGLTSRTDAGVYFTKNPNANYGFYGVQVQHNVLRSETTGWSASTRVNFMALYGPEDLSFSAVGLDLVASRKYRLWSGRAAIEPYATVSTSLSSAHEKSAVVDLRDERIVGAHGSVGAAARVSAATLGVEYAVGRVNSLSMKVGFGL